jgi:hypothetical protein
MKKKRKIMTETLVPGTLLVHSQTHRMMLVVSMCVDGDYDDDYVGYLGFVLNNKSGDSSIISKTFHPRISDWKECGWDVVVDMQ